MSCRTDNGIPDIRNGEHKLLQKQIDLMHEDVREIRDNIKIFGPMCAKNETRSHINTKLIFVVLTAICGLSAAVALL